MRILLWDLNVRSHSGETIKHTESNRNAQNEEQQKI